MTFFYPRHRRSPVIDKKSSLVMLLFLTAQAILTSVVLAQADVVESTSSGWEVADKKIDLELSTETQTVDQQMLDKKQAVDELQAAELESDSAEEDAEQVIEAESEAIVDNLSEQVESKEKVLERFDSIAEGGQSLEPISSQPNIPSRPTLDIDDDLRFQLEAQFQALQELKDTEDAFSERLGETFYSYGDALQRAGRIDEARDVFAQALHINKVNNGVNHIAQRPLLKSLAWVELAAGDIEKAEEYVSRMIWVEKQQRAVYDTFSYDVILALGNKILDQYLYRPVVGESSLATLNSASKYFKYIIRRYGDQPLDRLFMPYGELAYTQHLKLRLAPGVQRSYSNQRFDEPFRGQQFPSGIRGRESRLPEPTRRVYGSIDTGEQYMREYLSKAGRADDAEHKVQALLNLGDIHQLLGRSGLASRFYERAWIEAQELDEDHELVVGMSRPHKLPAFFYASDRDIDNVVTSTPRAKVPLDISVNSEGRVKTIFTDPDGTDSPKLTSRARRMVKQITFRPAIEAGKLVGTDRYTELVRVVVRKNDKVAADTSGD